MLQTCMNLEDIRLHHNTKNKKQQILYDSNYEVPRIVNLIDTEGRMAVARAWVCVGQAREVIVYSCRFARFLWIVITYNIVNALNATELHLKMVHFVYFIVI